MKTKIIIWGSDGLKNSSLKKQKPNGEAVVSRVVKESFELTIDVPMIPKKEITAIICNGKRFVPA